MAFGKKVIVNAPYSYTAIRKQQLAEQDEINTLANAADANLDDLEMVKAGIKTLAVKWHAQYPQYVGHWDGPEWRLAYAKREITLKGGLTVRKGDYVIARQPTESDGEHGISANSVLVHSLLRQVGCWLRGSDIKFLEPEFTCPAHETIYRELTEATEPDLLGLADPLPTDCAKWIAELTNGAPAKTRYLPDGVADNFCTNDLDELEPVRQVMWRADQYECYKLYRVGDRLTVLFYTDIGSGPDPYRIDFTVEGWK